MKQFYLGIDIETIDHDHFVVHFAHGDLAVTRDTIEAVTQVPSPPQHVATLPLIDYLTLMGVRCTELDMVFEQISYFVTFIALDVGSNAIF